ncbi:MULTISPECIES: DNA-binding protein [Clostridium]|uniref:DNA-binding protein n=1 Tax=Clostridium sp. BL8 TaxID=1354301 RepID=UPI0009E63591|nr:DNA-binding protein [Clostridium sp. BL8]
MHYITVQEAAPKWSIRTRRVQALCAEGRIKGAKKHASVWAIPESSEKPYDARIISGKYKKIINI